MYLRWKGMESTEEGDVLVRTAPIPLSCRCSLADRDKAFARKGDGAASIIWLWDTLQCDYSGATDTARILP